jgi:hypothetical protein
VRAVLGLLLLLALFGAASYWQGSWTASLREERDVLQRPPGTLEEREEGWGRIVIGRPSGADPIELPEPIADPAEGRGTPRFRRTDEKTPEETKAVQPVTPPPPADFEYLVPGGRVLSKICEEFYGSGRDPIPATVATYNGLASPDELRAGKTLKLPEWEVLFPGQERP